MKKITFDDVAPWLWIPLVILLMLIFGAWPGCEGKC